jgi:hypothetical protein
MTNIQEKNELAALPIEIYAVLTKEEQGGGSIILSQGFVGLASFPIALGRRKMVGLLRACDNRKWASFFLIGK